MSDFTFCQLCGKPMSGDSADAFSVPEMEAYCCCKSCHDYYYTIMFVLDTDDEAQKWRDDSMDNKSDLVASTALLILSVVAAIFTGTHSGWLSWPCIASVAVMGICAALAARFVTLRTKLNHNFIAIERKAEKKAQDILLREGRRHSDGTEKA